MEEKNLSSRAAAAAASENHNEAKSSSCCSNTYTAGSREHVSKSKREFQVLIELNAICLSLDRISNVLDDLLLLTELPAATNIDTETLCTSNTSVDGFGSRNNRNYSTYGDSSISTSSTNGIVSIAHKQRLLIEELTRWKDVLHGGDATEDQLHTQK